MWRRLVLITSPGEKGSEDYLRGVKLDAQNYYGFYSSAQGGLYNGAEIQHLDMPNVDMLREELRRIPFYFFSTIIYLGHAHLSPGGRTILQLRDSEMDSMELARYAPVKSTVILDCCRFTLADSVDLSLRKSLIEVPKVIVNPEQCRSLYDGAIDDSKNGKVVVFACSAGEKAYESDEVGGLFSHSLISAGESFVRTYDPSKAPNIMTIAEAVTAANALLEDLSGGKQTATIVKTVTGADFPFSVAA